MEIKDFLVSIYLIIYLINEESNEIAIKRRPEIVYPQTGYSEGILPTTSSQSSSLPNSKPKSKSKSPRANQNKKKSYFLVTLLINFLFLKQLTHLKINNKVKGK